VARIDGRVPPLVMNLVGRPDVPQPEPNYAKLCLRFVAACRLVKGRVDIPEFNDRAVLNDPAIHDLAARVHPVLDDNPDVNALAPQWFKITLKSGAEHQIHLPQVYGHPEAALTDAENLEKFRRVTGFARAPLPEAQASALVDAVAAADDLPDAAALAKLCVVEGARG